MAGISRKHIPYLYKYRSLTNKDYILDIINNHRLYFPTRSELNDPLEGVIQPIHFHTMGSTFFLENGYLQPEFSMMLEEYRILSLTQAWNNMQMWAHYANNYNGICITFKFTEIFEDAKEVKYKSKKLRPIMEEDITSEKIRDAIIGRNLLYKSKNWEYEHEYRIIKKTSEQYFYFPQNCIEEIIFGNVVDMEKSTVVEIAQACNRHKIKLSHITFCTDYFEIQKEPFYLSKYLNEEYNPYISNDLIVCGDECFQVRTYFAGDLRFIKNEDWRNIEK